MVDQSSLKFLGAERNFSILHAHTVFPRFSPPGRLPIFEAFGGALNRAGALIKTDENVDSELLGQEKEKMDWLYLVYIMGIHPRIKLQKH